MDTGDDSTDAKTKPLTIDDLNEISTLSALSNVDKEDILKLYNSCIEYFNYVQEISDELYISIDAIEDMYETLLCDNMIIMYEGNENIIEGIKFYNRIFTKTMQIETYSDLVDVVEYYLSDEHTQFTTTQYNILICCLKIQTHLFWHYCMHLSPNLWRTNPDDAIRDIICYRESAIEEMKIIHEIIKKRKNAGTGIN